MRRVTDLIVRNWPLKLGAIALATILYTGLVLGQNVRTWTGTLPIDVLRQPADAALLSDVPPVTQVRFRAPLDVGVVSPTSFTASVDLSRVEAQPGGPVENVPVTVIALDSRIQVVDYQPQEIPIQLDPVATREMPVIVIIGQIPNGISNAPPQVDPSDVNITGASSRVNVVAQVIAPVALDASGLNVDREVDLVAVDSNGNQVPNVEIEPDHARVRVAVARELANVTLPVVPQIVGVPAPGYRISSVTVEPLVVTVSGEASIVSQMQTAPTEVIDVADRTSDLEASVRFELPEGVSVSGNDTVRVVVTIEEETGTRTFVVGVQADGLDDPQGVVVTPDQVSITLGGPLAALEVVKATQLVATATVSSPTTGGTATVRFEPPPGLELVSISPTQVEVTVVVPVSPSPLISPAAGP